MKKIIILVMATICLQFVAGEDIERSKTDTTITGESVQDGSTTIDAEVIDNIQIAFDYYLEMNGDAENVNPEYSFLYDISYYKFEYTTQYGHDFIMIYIYIDLNKKMVLGGSAFILLDADTKKVVYFMGYE